MRYVSARYGLYQREMAYRIYVGESLRMISESAAKFGGGEYMTKKFVDLIHPQETDERTAEEIIAGTIKGAGIEVVF